jgi:hypothetical protein
MAETLRLEGVEELLKKLTSLEDMRRVKAAIALSADMLRGRLAEYPVRSSRPNMMLKLNDKMRRGFFAKLKSGEIEVPYRRGQSPGSEKLGQSWTVRKSNYGFKATIGTGVSYARLVQDSAKQTSYHRGTGWITTKQTALLYGNEAMQQIEAAFKQEVQNG